MGRQIELVIRDDQAKPEVGAAMAKELVEKEKVVAVVGFANTGVALPSAKVLQEAKIPVIVSGATGASVTKTFMPPAYPVSYVFRTSASDSLQPIVILNDVIDRRKLDKIAVLHDESPYGQFGRQSVLAELERRKIKPVAVEGFKVGESDMKAQMLRVKESSLSRAFRAFADRPAAFRFAGSRRSAAASMPGSRAASLAAAHGGCRYASRNVPGAADDILRTLEAFGFEWDGPCFQSSARGLCRGAGAAEAGRAGLRLRLLAQGNRRLGDACRDRWRPGLSGHLPRWFAGGPGGAGLAPARR
jgi:hypothetical protein